jgi:hypothetical protein
VAKITGVKQILIFQGLKMSVFNTDDDLGIPEEPVKSVEMEDVSANEMDTAPAAGDDEPAAEEGAGSPVDMERNSPIGMLCDFFLFFILAPPLIVKLAEDLV